MSQSFIDAIKIPFLVVTKVKKNQPKIRLNRMFY
jgi:hypothetical protein